MNKIYSHKSIIIFLIIGVLYFFGAGCFSIFMLISSFNDGQKNNIQLNIVFIVFVFISLPFLILALNRLGNKVIYDSTNNIICRTGFFGGYRYKLSIHDIVDIITVYFPKETTFYIIIDKVNKKYDGGFKNSFIRIEKNNKSLEFIKLFWNKPIKESVSYFDLKK